MGISARPYPGVVVRTGAERATLVRRTYSLVFASILVTIAGAAFAMSQPAIMQSVARHPFITMIGMFAPLMLALKFREAFPANLGLVFLFTFVAGLAISPILYVYGRNSPGVIGQAGMLTAAPSVS